MSTEPIPPPLPHIAIRDAVRTTAIGGLTSVALGIIKVTTGLLGQSYALVADGIESLTDVVASVALLLGLTMSVKPPDEEHPYGHGKLETLAGLFVAFAILIAATIITVESIREILTPHMTPKWFTLPVLVVTIIVKIFTSRALARVSEKHSSAAMKAESWHQLSDAITSGAAFIGISIALAGGGNRWASADDWATLVACTVIYWNGFRLAKQAGNDLLDRAPGQDMMARLRAIAGSVEGVMGIEKMRVRQSGMGFMMDIHVEVDPLMTVVDSHEIARAVKRTLLASECRVHDVIVHIEPFLAESS
ncbi:MAG: cation diffusion facilitator family transporter [Candidatus Sumerlaeota bacterium]